MDPQLELTNLRLTIDAYAHMVSGSVNTGHLGYSDQVKECRKSLFLAKGWLGKALGKLGKDSPYRNDGARKSVTDIEKTAEHNVTVINDVYNHSGFENKNIVERIDWMRQEISILVMRANNIFDYGVFGEVIGGHITNNALTHLAEARFWLGFELEAIKNAETSDAT